MNATLGRRLCVLPFAAALLMTTSPILAQTPSAPPTVELSADASRRAPNDLASASAFHEATGTDTAALAREVNAVIAQALETARAYPDVSTRSSAVSTFPVYAQDGRSIEAWRLRSELHLESRNIAALSELLGKLQGALAISSLVLQPAPETRDATSDLAVTDAIRAFEARAASVSSTLGKNYRIRSLVIDYGSSRQPVFPPMRAMAMAADAAPMPIESGETDVSVGVTGTIELLDK